MFMKVIYNFFSIIKKNALFFNYILQDIFSEYKFGLRDRFMGAKICCFGYNSKFTEKLVSTVSEFNEFEVGDHSILTKKNLFRAGELTHIYNETFLPVKLNPHSYETNFIKIEKGDVVFDVGACEGFFSLHALNNFADSVYMFEPAKDLFEGLQKTFDTQLKQKKIYLVNKALSDKTGFLKFKTDEEYICMAKLDECGSDLIDVTTVDEFVASNKIFKINFIKADVEGAEVDLINGALKTLKQFKPKLSIAVYHKYENAMLIKSLILKNCPEYKIKLSGCYMFEKPYRPYMLYAWV